ncbi:MAG: hypothetical protein K9G41_11835 [Flavobacteriales bacterium]|nr:hypothetical protein [Flavobacteriales bacterium]
MKNLLLISICLLASVAVSAQNVGIGSTSFTPEADAILELRSTTTGFLMPRMTAAQMAAISGPTEGLLVYQTNATKGFKYFDGSVWTSFGGASGPDNFGNHTATANIRLNDFWLSNDGGNEGIRVTNDGKVGVGVAVPTYPLELSSVGVNAGPISTTDQVLARFEQSSTSRGAGIQIRGFRAISQVSAFVDLINYDENVSNEYIMSRVAGLTEDNGEKGALVLYTNGGGSSNSGLTEKMRVTSDGKVGIGTISPNAKLEVAGDARITDLAGTGTRMVVANANGDLSTQAIPSSGGGGFGSGTTLNLNVTSDINNQNVSGVSIIRLDANNSSHEIKGLTGGVAGQVICIVNTDSNHKVKFKKDQGTQQFRNDLEVDKEDGAIIMYDGSYWYVLSKD